MRLTDEQLDWLCEQVPDAPKSPLGGRPLRRSKRPFTVERTIAWFQNFRRLCIRWEKSMTLFKGYLHLDLPWKT